MIILYAYVIRKDDGRLYGKSDSAYPLIFASKQHAINKSIYMGLENTHIETYKMKLMREESYNVNKETFYR